MSGISHPAHSEALSAEPTFRAAIAESYRSGAALARSVHASRPSFSRSNLAADPIRAVLLSYVHCLDFSGRATRMQLLYTLLFILMAGAFISKPAQSLPGIYALVPLYVIGFPMLALHIRRLKDMGWPRLLVAILPFYFPAYLALLAVSLVKGPAHRA